MRTRGRAKPVSSGTPASSVFLSYAKEDKAHVDKVYLRLKQVGLSPWMDKPPAPFTGLGLPPGAVWDREIRRQLQNARVVLAFLSRKSIAKHGYVQQEYRLALREMMRKPPGDIYLIPVLFERCDPPDVQVDTVNLKDLQWFELFSRPPEELIEYLRKHTSGTSRAESTGPSVSEVVEQNRHYLWDVDLSSINGLILVHMAALARDRDVAVDLQELCNAGKDNRL